MIIKAGLLPFAAVALLSAGPASDSVTFPFQLQDNLVRLTGTLNGKPVIAVLDSGTGGIVVERSIVRRLGLQEGRSMGVSYGGGSKQGALYPVEIKSLEIGPIKLTGTRGVATDLTSLSSSAGFPTEVLLGTQVFLQHQIKVDYPRRKVTFTPNAGAKACANAVPVDLSIGVPIVSVVVRADKNSAPVKLRMIVDLGTRHFAAIIGGKFLDSAAGKSLLARSKEQQVGTGTGGPVAGYTVEADSMALGPREFRRLTLALTRQVPAFNSGYADGTLGVPLLANGSITFDYARNQLCLS